MTWDPRASPCIIHIFLLGGGGEDELFINVEGTTGYMKNGTFRSISFLHKDKLQMNQVSKHTCISTHLSSLMPACIQTYKFWGERELILPQTWSGVYISFNKAEMFG